MNTTTTLAELAVARPAASRVFQRLGLDYCCGGRRPLADACRTKGLDPEEVIHSIAQEEAGVDLPRWDTAALPELIDFIVDRYHASLRTELPALMAMADRVENTHAEKSTCPRGLRAHLGAVYESVLSHLAKEETILFPLIRAGQGRMVAGPVRVMEEEHDDHGRNLQRIRQLTDNLTPPDEACATWRALYLRLGALEADLMEHIHLENNVLFPRALGEAENG